MHEIENNDVSELCDELDIILEDDMAEENSENINEEEHECSHFSNNLNKKPLAGYKKLHTALENSKVTQPHIIFIDHKDSNRNVIHLLFHLLSIASL